MEPVRFDPWITRSAKAEAHKVGRLEKNFAERYAIASGR
jgi:hypothetical protein